MSLTRVANGALKFVRVKCVTVVTNTCIGMDGSPVEPD